jgi:hypothetical protein
MILSWALGTFNKELKRPIRSNFYVNYREYGSSEDSWQKATPEGDILHVHLKPLASKTRYELVAVVEQIDASGVRRETQSRTYVISTSGAGWLIKHSVTIIEI